MPLINEDFISITDPNGNDNNIMTNMGSTRTRETFSATQYLTGPTYITDKKFDMKHKWFPSIYGSTGTINLTGTENMPEIKLKGFDIYLSSITATTKILISDSAGNTYDQILIPTSNGMALDFGENGLRIVKNPANPTAYFIVSIVNGAGTITLTGWKN